jgi:hypothetical protein
MLPPEKKPFDRFFTFCFYIPWANPTTFEFTSVVVGESVFTCEKILVSTSVAFFKLTYSLR